MDAKAVKYYESRLLEERKKIIEQLYGEKEKLGDFNKNEVGDMVDIAYNMYQKDLTIEMSENEKKLLRLIDGALMRIKNKVYGNCNVCGKAIDTKRLKIVPWAMTCVDLKKCKSAKK